MLPSFTSHSHTFTSPIILSHPPPVRQQTRSPSNLPETISLKSSNSRPSSLIIESESSQEDTTF